MTITAVGQINQSAVNVTWNKELDIFCEVESHPSAQVHWEENGVPVDGSSGEVTRLKVTANSAIRGANITYTCVAENVVGGNNHSVSNNITVYVQGKILCYKHWSCSVELFLPLQPFLMLYLVMI